jgi:acylphosphatase
MEKQGMMAGRSKDLVRRYLVRGRVQGVGYRYFVERIALELGLTGFVRNLAEGGVEVVARGSPRDLDTLEGLLHQGPLWAEVRHVEVSEAPMVNYEGFRIRS